MPGTKEVKILMSHSVFPTPDIKATARYYKEVLGFKLVEYLNADEPHICLYRDSIEIILTSTDKTVMPNRKYYGYGYDAYLITSQPELLQQHFVERGAKIVKQVSLTDYHNQEFVLEDCDGRWLGFGIKE
ncbi:MAG: VOC family protein [Carnobacterium sp.]|uniref:VOC family protein n=1 Tax=Lactobacillales TaxID=186826 RepID=UPI00257D6AD1|nr:VOC family protein [Carnobacterium sp.]MBQ6484778.1 VOC family protein [Carnobacterium sp.]